MNTPIHDFLVSYSESSPLRCHMPGAKGLVYPFDITEIDGADSLFESGGIIAESEKNAASLFGAEKTLFSAAGSTLAIQTMLALAKAFGKGRNRIIAHRYAHKSLVNSCVLLGLEIDWVFPEEYLSCAVTPKQLEPLITEETLAVFVQSVDYYGGECDIKPIAELCRKKGIPLLADNAHGAYKVFTDDHPLLQGADMTADSAHKTLPCITGGAYLHISKSAPDGYAQRAKEIMSLFGSSSPSYLILDSLDLCNRHISEEKAAALDIIGKIGELKKSLEAMGYKMKKSDHMRITLDCAEYGYEGFELAAALREKGLECELADERFVVLLFSTCTKLSDFPEIKRIFGLIPKRAPIKTTLLPIYRPTKAVSMREAFFSPREEIPVMDGVGRICAAAVAPCPPCVPAVMPGELLDENAVELLERLGVQKISVIK